MNSERFEWVSAVGAALKYVALLLILLIVLFPIYWMVITSFKNRLELTTYPPSVFPRTIILDNYNDAFSRNTIPRYMLNSVIVVSISTFISVIFGTLAGYSLARFAFTPRFKRNMWFLDTLDSRDSAHCDGHPALFDLPRLETAEHLPGTDHPVHRVYAAVHNVDDARLHPRSPG